MAESDRRNEKKSTKKKKKHSEYNTNTPDDDDPPAPGGKTMRKRKDKKSKSKSKSKNKSASMDHDPEDEEMQLVEPIFQPKQQDKQQQDNHNDKSKSSSTKSSHNGKHPGGALKSVNFGADPNVSNVSILAGDTLRSHDTDTEQALTEDIYSLLYISRMTSQSFIFAFLVFFVQNAVLWLIFLDLLDFDSEDNVIGLPPGVPVMVNIAQGLGVLLIVMTITANGDLTSGISRLVTGYSQVVLADHPGAHRFKWFLAGSLQVIVGLVMVLDLFILMMQSETVVGLCLNFAALHFVQEIDDISFMVGQKGFLSRSLQYDCLEVSELMVPKRRGRLKRRARQGLTLALTILMYIPYGVLVNRQLTGRFVCRSLQVQFGDAFLPELAFFGGRYNIARNNNIFDKIDFRTIYYDVSETIMLAYCNKEKAWTFAPNFNNTDPCNYFVKSSRTKTFDVLEVRDQTWFTWNTETEKSVPADWLFVQRSDCGKDKDLCPSDIGVCVDNVCKCRPERMGRECEFGPPTCNDLTIDGRTAPLPTEEGVIFPESYSILRHPVSNGTNSGAVVTVHQRPVYVSETRLEFSKSWDLMLFAGRRWIIYAAKSTSDYNDNFYTPELLAEKQGAKNDFYSNLLSATTTSTLNDLDDYLIDQNRIYQNLIENYRPYFFSGPVDYGTATDVLEPNGLDWFRAKKTIDAYWNFVWSADESYPVEVKFLCEACDPLLNPCFNNGACNPNNQRCECPEYYVGSLCEQPVRCNPPTQICLNRGNCSDWRGYCDCPGPFYGNLCQFQLSATTLLP